MKTISIVLGSGGARGYVHIGVIEELLEHGYEIKSISGSSMGALIGGLYACEKLNEFKTWVLTLDLFDVAKLVDFSFTTTGVIQGDKVFAVIEEMIGDVMIEELPIPFTAVATDLIRQKEVWIQKGRVVDAIRAKNIKFISQKKSVKKRMVCRRSFLRWHKRLKSCLLERKKLPLTRWVCLTLWAERSISCKTLY